MKGNVKTAEKSTPEALKEYIDQLGRPSKTGNEQMARETTLKRCQTLLDFCSGDADVEFVRDYARSYFFAYKDALDDVSHLLRGAIQGAREIETLFEGWPRN